MIIKFIKKVIRIAIYLLLLLSPFLIPRTLKINKIECVSQFGSCQNDISSGLEAMKGKNYSYVKKNINKQLKSEPSVFSYKTNIKLPGTVIVVLNEKRPLYSITNQDKKSFSNLDSEGVVISKTESSVWPYIISEGEPPEKGKTITSEQLFALNIMRDINTIYSVKEGKIENGGLVIELPDNLRVIFPLEGDREVLVGSLVLLHSEISNKNNSKFEFSSGTTKLVDLRYKNPILKSI